MVPIFSQVETTNTSNNIQIDFFDSKFLKEHIKYINKNEGGNYNENDYYRAGIFIGHELAQNNFAFVSQIGYTFYSQYPY